MRGHPPPPRPPHLFRGLLQQRHGVPCCQHLPYLHHPSLADVERGRGRPHVHDPRQGLYRPRFVLRSQGRPGGLG